MAAAPPPYSPRDQRRMARDYARAQRDQARAQRHYWRGYRRSSITGPLILVTVGIIAFLIETGKVSGYAVWDWYSHWWPVLLISIGLISLAEYFLDRDNPYAGRRSAGGIVFLILLFAFFGWGSHSARNWGPFSEQFGSNGEDFFSMLGEEHDNDVQVDQTIAASGTVNVQNPRGDVTVTTSSDGQMHMRAHEVVHSGSDDNAKKLFDQVTPRITSSSSGAVISVPSKNGARVDLTLQLPEKLFATIEAGRGDVTVDGMKNNVDVTSHHGDVKFNNIGGDVHARMDHGDVSAHQVTGHALVDGHADDVTLSEIKGNVILDGEFFGDTHLEQIGSTVHFHTSRTDLDIPSLGGDLTMDSKDLTASQVTGPVRLNTRSKDIDLSQVAGDVHIENSDGDVNVVAAVPLGNVQISNRSGAVSLTVPDNANFGITASTNEDDDLETDFPLQTSTSGDRRRLEGTVGKGGVKLELTTSHGNLELKKGSSQPLPSPPPPSAPKAPGKHFKAAPGAPPAPTEQ
jgi:Putative adhesin